MANVKGDGGASTSTLFSRSVDPIKKIPSVSFDAVTEGNTPVTVEQWLEAAFYPFIPASISFSGDGPQEDGLTSNNVVLNGGVVPNEEDNFTNFELKEGTTVIASNTAGTLTLPTNASPPSAVSQPWSFTRDVTENKTYSIHIQGNADGVRQHQVLNHSLQFYYPTYYHAGASALTIENIKANGTKSVLGSQVSDHTYTVTNGHFYLAYPKYIAVTQETGFPALTSILNPSDYQVLTSMTRREDDLTMADSETITYYIYEWTDETTQPSFKLTFS